MPGSVNPKFVAYWNDLWRRLRGLGVTGSGEGVCSELIMRYSESHRRYHNLDHIMHCLDLFPMVRGRCPQPEVAELAICFHDVVYEPLRKDNEERSAELAMSMLSECGLRAISDRVSQLVLATKTHMPQSEEEAAVVDLDLSSLGCSPEQFDENSRRIDEEFLQYIPRVVYNLGRNRFLESMLKRDHIFTLPEMEKAFETKARENIRRRLGEKE